MGLLDRIKNWFKTRFSKKKEVSEEVPLPPEDYEEETQELQIQEENRPEEPIKRVFQEEQLTLEEKQDDETARKLKEDEEELKPRIAGLQSYYKDTRDLAEVNREVTENLNDEVYNMIEYSGILDGLSYSRHMKDAVLSRQITIDEQIADLIVMNAGKMRGRFTTIVDVWVDGDEVLRLNFAGGLINEVHPEIAHSELKVDNEVDSWKLQQICFKLIDDIESRFGYKGIIQPLGDINKEGKITNVRVRTSFN